MAEPLWTRDEIAAATGGHAAGPAFAADGVSIDSRTIEAGDHSSSLAPAHSAGSSASTTV